MREKKTWTSSRRQKRLLLKTDEKVRKGGRVSRK